MNKTLPVERQQNYKLSTGLRELKTNPQNKTREKLKEANNTKSPHNFLIEG